VLLLGHFDTVWPVGQIDAMPVRRENGRLYGPGSYDMKAGIAMTLLAARILIEANRLPSHRIAMIWTSDEEVGSDTSRAILEAEARRSRAVFVLEPALAGGGVKTARKGVADFRIEATGISAHAGVEPDKGASAIHELAWQAIQLLALNDPSRGLTINVGCIVGGTRPNVVAAEATMDVDVRIPTQADAALVTTAITTLVPRDPRVRLRVTGGVNRPPMERTAGVAALYERAARIARQLGRELPEGATGGGSDGNFTAALGIPTLDGLGPDGAGAHALHEHVLIDSVPFRAALLAELLRLD
jgi:glutamate carboxypeptidase